MSSKAKSLVMGAVLDALTPPAPQPKGAAAAVSRPARHGHPARRLFEPSIVRRAIFDSFAKLDPRHQIRSPVMFVVEVGAVLTTLLFVEALTGRGDAPAGFILAVSLTLWFTVLFASFAEAMAESRGKAQADSLRQARRETLAKRLPEDARTRDAPVETVSSSLLRKGDVVLIETKATWYVYRVTGHQIVAPTQTSVILPVPDEPDAEPTAALLTMTSCHPEFSARQRFIVHGELEATYPHAQGVPAEVLAVSG